MFKWIMGILLVLILAVLFHGTYQYYKTQKPDATVNPYRPDTTHTDMSAWWIIATNL